MVTRPTRLGTVITSTVVVAALAGAAPVAAHAMVAAGTTSTPQSDPIDGEDRGTLIVGGRPAKEGDYPWMARLSMKCGGTFISPDIILTAEHCMIESRPTAYFGSVNDQGTDSRKTVAVRKGSIDQWKDWAVLKMDRPVSLPSYPLIPKDKTYDNVSSFRGIGWGMMRENGPQSKVLNEVDLPSVAPEYCTTSPSTEICAGDMIKGGVDTCQGDSGGPLLSKATDGWVQVGIVSWGNGCGRPKEAGHYARVSAFTDIILKSIDEMGGQRPANFPKEPGPGPAPTPTSAPTPTAAPTPTSTRPPRPPRPTGGPGPWPPWPTGRP